jgi:hypothetical protein
MTALDIGVEDSDPHFYRTKLGDPHHRINSTGFARWQVAALDRGTISPQEYVAEDPLVSSVEFYFS